MKFCFGILALWALLLSGSAFPQEPQTQLSASEYIEELNRIEAEVRGLKDEPQSVLQFLRNQPPQWRVRIGTETCRIESRRLWSDLNIGQEPEAAVGQILDRIAALERDALAFQNPPPDSSAAKAALAEILAQPEFSAVHGPTAWDRFLERLHLFLYRLLSGIFGSSAFPAIGEIFVWVLVGLAFLVLAVWIFRTLRRGAALEIMALEPPPDSTRPWAEWMIEAQAAAAKGLWRDAVHLSYRTGISFLEARGLWRPDQSRTPREYLRLIGSRSEYGDSLSGLTRLFETVWYGYSAAGPQSFSEAMVHLENMGCRSN